VRRHRSGAFAPTAWELRWFVAAWVALAFVAISWGLRAEERTLESAARDALAEAGIDVDDVTFSGRDGVVMATLGTADRTRAESALAGVSGIRRLDWQVTAPPIQVAPVTTTTTTLPPGDVAGIEVRVKAGKVFIRGLVRDAAAIARIDDAAERFYGPTVANNLRVGDVWMPSWLERAPEVIAASTAADQIELTMDGTGITLVGAVADEAKAASLRERLQDLVGPDAALDVELTVIGGDLPSITIVAADGTVSVDGAVNRRTLAESILAAVEGTSGGSKIRGELAFDKALPETYATSRLTRLITRFGAAASWSLEVDAGSLMGSAADGGFFKGMRPEPTDRAEALIEELAAQLLADPALGIEIEVAAPSPGGAAGNVELAASRIGELVEALVRAGVDPDRITTSAGRTEGDLLWFRLEATDG
jgi:hypothetical protein